MKLEYAAICNCWVNVDPPAVQRGDRPEATGLPGNFDTTTHTSTGSIPFTLFGGSFHRPRDALLCHLHRIPPWDPGTVKSD